MRTVMIAAALLAASVVGGCMGQQTAVPPLVAPAVPRKSIDIKYTRLRVYIAPFRDRTTLLGGVSSMDTHPFYRSGAYLLAAPGSEISPPGGSAGGVEKAPGAPMALSAIPAGGTTLVQTLPDQIAGILGQSGRFEVMADPNAQTDLVLYGALTAVQGGTATLDMRLISADTNSDMASVTVPVKYQAASNEIIANRDDLKNAVTKLVGALPSPKDIKKGQILSRDGRFVTINLGGDDKVMKGMKAFAVTYGDRIVDPKSGEMLGDETFTADLYVFAVYNKVSRAYIVTDEKKEDTKVKVGDYVVFK